MNEKLMSTKSFGDYFVKVSWLKCVSNWTKIGQKKDIHNWSYIESEIQMERN